MKKILNKLNNNKLKLILIIVLITLVVYIIVILKFIYNNKLAIDIINHDLNIKRIEKEHLVSEIVRVNIEKQDYIFLLDFDTDNSLQKFVTSNKSFNNKSFSPNDLVNISSNVVFDIKWKTQQLRKIVNDNLQLMANKFYEEFWEKMVVVSAYRSYNYQVWIKNRGCPDNLCAKAGYSEHQSGLAMDLWEVSTNYEWKNNKKLQRYYKWLSDNANAFGFHNTYQKWLEIDWYEIEPWHWRYLWEELSTYLKDNNLTIAEFYKQK